MFEIPFDGAESVVDTGREDERRRERFRAFFHPDEVWTPEAVGIGLKSYLVYRWHVDAGRTEVRLMPKGSEYRVDVWLEDDKQVERIERDLKELLPAEFRLFVRVRK